MENMFFIYDEIEYVNCGTVESDNSIFLILRKDDDNADYFFLKKKDDSWIIPSQKEIEDLSEIYKNDFNGAFHLIDNIKYQEGSNILDQNTPIEVLEALDKNYCYLLKRFRDKKFNKDFAQYNISTLVYSKNSDLTEGEIASYIPDINQIITKDNPEIRVVSHEGWHMFSAKPNFLGAVFNCFNIGLATHHFNSIKGGAINEGVTQYLTEQTHGIKDGDYYEIYVRIAKMMEILYGDQLYQSYFNADRKSLYDFGDQLGYKRNKTKGLFFASDALLKWEMYATNMCIMADNKEDKISNNSESIRNRLDLILNKYKIKKQTHLMQIQLILIDMFETFLKNTIDSNEPSEELYSYIVGVIQTFKENLILNSPEKSLDVEMVRRLSNGLSEVEKSFNSIVNSAMNRLKLVKGNSSNNNQGPTKK